ncbi:CBL-interacting serine/threonine-protein kinase 15 [Rhynchospora pubera]|uniref:non-specific serine/threonine protein kinase n=1 Tax=Rhynchospora pubera TaxID=906938 RepID=A0AAV8F0G7_9POAL|nr:CBL-interacting serine/threonine-protein kinase 15 [Rhynchospora pubera]
MESKSILLEKYEVGRLLGQGTFAKVYLAKNLKSGQTVAIKAFDKEKVFKVSLTEQIKREISVMKMVNHPNIIKLYEVMATKKKIYFAMEYAKGGELFQKIAKGGRVKEEIAHRYFRQLIDAVDFCHSRGIYHRDLKLENLLLDEEDNLKVTDFGLSALIRLEQQGGLLHTTCGTPAYVAPEVLSKKGYDGAKTDIWSCGVILFVLVAGYLPFHDSNLMEMYKKIQKGEFKCPSWFSSRLKKLLHKILDPDPSTRLTVEGIKGMSWYRKGFDRDQVPKEKKIKENATVVKEKREKMKVASMNAFDIISLSSGFDLSGFFVERENRNETWFTSRQPVSVLVSRLEELGKKLKLRVRKKENGVVKMMTRNGGRKGVVEIDAEIFQIDCSSYMVEIKKSNGDTLEYQKILKEKIRPGLKDIIWTWQGDKLE